MPHDDDEECLIKKGERERWMSLKDANNAIKVKEKFGLDYEPACVFIHRRDRKTRVEFGDLKSDLHYHLEDPNKIADQTSHARNALWMSKAAYANKPADALQETIQKHTIHTIHAVSNPKHCDQGVILAVGRVNNKDTLYVAYRGTTTWSAAIADADIALQKEPRIPGGRIHSGFSKRSRETARARDIVYCATIANCETIITCGHSLGGAVSSVSALDLLQFLGKDTEIKVHNITFGAPFFANQPVRKFCETKDFAQHFLHYVSCEDIVPCLLSLGHTCRIISEKLPGGMLQYAFSLLQTLS